MTNRERAWNLVYREGILRMTSEADAVDAIEEALDAAERETVRALVEEHDAAIEDADRDDGTNPSRVIVSNW